MKLPRLFRRRKRKEKPAPLMFMADQFASWAFEKEQGRHELIWHKVINTPPDRSGHALAKFHVARRLAEAFEAASVVADIYTGGLVIPIGAMHAYMPDLIVRFGPRLPLDATRCEDPDIVVEILPPEAERTETLKKAEQYFRVESLRHLLILRMDDPVILHHVRTKDDVVQGHLVQDGVVHLDPPGVSVGNLHLPPR